MMKCFLKSSTYILKVSFLINSFHKIINIKILPVEKLNFL